MRECDLASEREPDARSVRLGRKKGYENLLEQIAFDPAAVVAHLEDKRILLLNCGQSYGGIGKIGGCVCGIPEQVDDGLLDQGAIEVRQSVMMSLDDQLYTSAS